MRQPSHASSPTKPSQEQNAVTDVLILTSGETNVDDFLTRTGRSEISEFLWPKRNRTADQIIPLGHHVQ